MALPLTVRTVPIDVLVLLDIIAADFDLSIVRPRRCSLAPEVGAVVHERNPVSVLAAREQSDLLPAHVVLRVGIAS